MTYQPPNIGPAGLTIPKYPDILNDILGDFRKIYGANQYLGQDSAPYQFSSAVSLKISDCMSGIQFAYNNNSPASAVGIGLDRLVKLNGIARLAYTYSTAELTITGTAAAVITNGFAQDQNGNQWQLPSPVTIGGGGTVSVEATCTTPGNITAEPGTITKVATPQLGWSSVTNPGAAIPGNSIEPDSKLRARQAISVSLPAQTPLNSLIAAVSAVPGVTRTNIVENFTNSTDANGNPPHSVTAVVEGGVELAVATAILNQKSLGVYTNGTTTVPVTDPATGLITNINYDLPSYVPIYVSIYVHPLTGWSVAMEALIQNAIVNYLNDLDIGELVTYSALVSVAMSVTPNLENPAFSVRTLTLGTTPSPVSSNDIAMLFNQVAEGILANVLIGTV